MPLTSFGSAPTPRGVDAWQTHETHINLGARPKDPLLDLTFFYDRLTERCGFDFMDIDSASEAAANSTGTWVDLDRTLFPFKTSLVCESGDELFAARDVLYLQKMIKASQKLLQAQIRRSDFMKGELEEDPSGRNKLRLQIGERNSFDSKLSEILFCIVKPLDKVLIFLSH